MSTGVNITIVKGPNAHTRALEAMIASNNSEGKVGSTRQTKFLGQ